jgi:hypothetical protein
MVHAGSGQPELGNAGLGTPDWHALVYNHHSRIRLLVFHSRKWRLSCLHGVDPHFGGWLQPVTVLKIPKTIKTGNRYFPLIFQELWGFWTESLRRLLMQMKLTIGGIIVPVEAGYATHKAL